MTNSDTTNLFGSYTVRFTGSSLANPDVRNCNAQITGFGQGSNSCGAVPGPAKPIRLMFSMYDMEIYTVDALLSQPSEPLAFCPRSATPLPNPVSTPPSIPPPFNPVTPPSLTNPINPTTPPSPPTVRLPPMPFLESSACPYQKWTMPEYRCHWSVVEPDTKVAVAFGLIAARKYGTDMTLRKGLQGRGDVYRTLLREATTALLNSYNSIHFGYPTLSVIGNMNAALMGSPRHALFMALRFKRANSGYGTVRCNFTPCK
ncbi:hypothetical protein GIB67_033858 [Kingdonia uniflora]|nr:hypothetical protein GIB67_033858 [Kingdonia uniflora]